MMHPVRYIHAADLHLDAAFKGLASVPRSPRSDPLRHALHEAGFTAVQRLFSLAEREQPDFLVIAGDIYNQEDRSIRAQLRLRDACEQLAAFGVRVFLAHGNHDPLTSRLHTLNWPANVAIFGSGPEHFPVTRGDETVAVVHGISHENAEEGRNLARLFERTPDSCFQLGVLHCTVEGCKAERYAPCSLEDLAASGLDAWALGHVHERTVLHEKNPFVLYPGNVQGLHINERGERGCMLVSAVPSEDGFSCSAVFKPLGPTLWEVCEVDITNLNGLDEVDAALREAAEKLAAEAPYGCEALVIRLLLTGRTHLDAELRRPAVLSDLAGRLGEITVRPPIRIKDIEVKTRPEADMEILREREDLLGETLRLARAGRENTGTLRALVEPSCKHLPDKTRRILPALSDEECAQLLDEAERLCIDLLEAGS